VQKKWLTVVGIGEDGVPGLGLKALVAVQNAAFIFGGERHLAMLGSNITATRQGWTQPLSDSLEKLAELRGQKVVVLASGDPMFYGIGSTLIEHIPLDEIDIIPHPSSFSYACARLGWSMQDVLCRSIHARSLETVAQDIGDAARLLILAHDGNSPADLAHLFISLGFGKSVFHILEHLGGAREKITHLTAFEIGEQAFADLNLIAVECHGDGSEIRHRTNTVLPDSAFAHDGQLTKQDIRAVVMAHLAPKYNELLWDIGAGCGSIAVEWLRLGRDCRAIAVERKTQRCDFIRRNGEILEVDGLEVLEADAADALNNLEAPHAIFIGGGFVDADVSGRCWQSLRPGGRLVATSVTLETEMLFQAFAAKTHARLIRINLSEVEELGRYHIWRPALPITVMIAHKPHS